MKVAYIKTTIDRRTSEVKNQEIVGYEEVNEDEYYRPLVEVFWMRIKKELEKGPESQTAPQAKLLV